MQRNGRWLRGALLGALLLGGCERPPQFAPVSGKVYYRGVPLRSGTIVLTPDPQRGTRGPLAWAAIQSDGSYTPRSDDQPGAVVGWHRVTVLAVEAERSTAAGGVLVPPRSLVPEKYRDPHLSGLRCEVQAGRDNRIDFQLE